jgi:regulator of protease activity HflC (stomatin/prohibitin superfamily)
MLVWLAGSRNPETPAGYVGDLTQGAVFGKATFWGRQAGPTSPGRAWLLSVVNVSVTPYTYSEDFAGAESVLSKDNLKVSFRVHVVWKVRADRVKELVERYSTLYDDHNADKVVRVAYNTFLREPLRTCARGATPRLNGLEIKDRITPIGDAIFRRVLDLTRGTTFPVTSVVVGNIQYPGGVADAVSRKIAATQEVERKQTEILIEEKEKQKRSVQAEGIARAMEIINQRLTAQYLQHEAIEARKAMVNSPNHTTIYIPVDPMGVPPVGTLKQPSSSAR